jgi:signal transduction histidine kinase
MRSLSRWFGPGPRLLLAFIALALGLVALTFDDVRGIRENGSTVQVGGKLRLDAQRAFRWLAEISNPDADAALARSQLTRYADAVSQSLSAVADGGTIEIAPGNIVDVRAPSLPESARSGARELAQIWTPLAARLRGLAAGEDDVAAVNAAARAAEPAFARGTSALLAAIGQDSLAHANRLRLIGGAGLVAALAFFLFLIWLYTRELSRVHAVQRETDDILQAVPAGLFLLGPDGRIGDRHSARLGALLQQTEIGGRDFFELLEHMVSPRTVQTARDYVQLLFGDRVHEELIGQLNPLDPVEVMLPSATGRMENRFLAFGFRRTARPARGGGNELMVTVTDVTDRVLLTRQLEVASAEGDTQTERLLDMVVALLRFEPGAMQTRLERWLGLVNDANSALKRSTRAGGDLRATVNEVFRPIHTLKSEAAALTLSLVVQRASAVEHELAELRTRPGLTGNDFLPVIVRLDEVFAQFDAIRRVMQRLPASVAAAAAGAATTNAPVGSSTASASPVPADSFALLDGVCDQVAVTLGKRASLKREGLDEATVPAPLRASVLEIATQLLRNAIAHGIETPAARLAAAKPPVGSVRIGFARVAGGWDLTAMDDGLGIDPERIRAHAIATGMVDAATGAAMGPKQLAALLFEPGFSTADAHDESAGRGVGLDLVRHVAARHGGRVSLSTAPGRYALFRVHFPESSAAEPARTGATGATRAA